MTFKQQNEFGLQIASFPLFFLLFVYGRLSIETGVHLGVAQAGGISQSGDWVPEKFHKASMTAVTKCLACMFGWQSAMCKKGVGFGSLMIGDSR